MKIKCLEIELTEEKLNSLLLESKKIQKHLENGQIIVTKDQIEIKGKVKISGFNKKLSATVQYKDLDKENGILQMNVVDIKPSFMGLSKKLLTMIPPNRYIESDNNSLKINLINLLQRIKYLESNNFRIDEIRIEDKAINISGGEKNNS